MTVDELKERIDLASYIRAQGIELKKHGRDWIGLCPFHSDSEPSLIVTPGKAGNGWGLWHCMGCGKGGSVIDFVVARDNCSVADAIAQLKEEHAKHNNTVGSGECDHSPAGLGAEPHHAKHVYFETLSRALPGYGRIPRTPRIVLYSCLRHMIRNSLSPEPLQLKEKSSGRDCSADCMS